jgi:GLPGLI family protein
MKRILIAFVALVSLSLTTQAQKKSGAIQFETTIDFVAMASANGMQLTDEMKARMPKAVKSNFELLFNATNASYMPVEDTEDSNGGGGGGGMARMMGRMGGAGGQREYYYSFADQKLVEVFDLSDTTYVMPNKLAVAPPANLNMGNRQGGNNNNGSTTTTGANGATTTTVNAVVYLPEPPTMEVVKTDETKKILNFNCNKVIVKTIRRAKVLGEDKNIIDETAVWYTNDLGFNFSPNPSLWTEGTVLAIENRGSTTVAKSIEYRNVSTKDVTAPKKALPITADEYKAKMETMMKRFQGGRQQGGAPTRVIIN